MSSNAPWSTSGYGQACLDLMPLIRDELAPGALAQNNFFGQAGGKFILDNIIQYPVINHTYGSDGLVMHGRDHKADAVFSLQDTWVLNPQDLQQTNRWIPWCPIDHDPVTQPVLANLKFAYRVISMSRFGQKALQDKGITSTYIPHMVNTEIYKPIDKIAARKVGNIPLDAFLIGMVAANKDNPPRKSFQEVMDAFKMFLEKVPNAYLYIHTNNDFPGGFNIRQYADFIGISERIAMPDAYQMNFNTNKEKMNIIYNTFDMLVAPSISEGFGVPIIEAQSCGVPVLTNDFTSMSEMIRPHITGYKTRVAYKRFSPQGSYFGIPDVQDIFDGMMTIYRMEKKKTSDAARKWIVENYDLKTVFKQKWVPFLDQLEKEVYGEKIVDKASESVA